jgi:hypothetical protein
MRHLPETAFFQDWQLGRHYGSEHDDYKGHHSEPRRQPEQHECPASGFEAGNKRGHEFRRLKSDFGESTSAEFRRIQEFLDPFRQKDGTDKQPDNDCCNRRSSSE